MDDLKVVSKGQTAVYHTADAKSCKESDHCLSYCRCQILQRVGSLSVILPIPNSAISKIDVNHITYAKFCNESDRCESYYLCQIMQCVRSLSPILLIPNPEMSQIISVLPVPNPAMSRIIVCCVSYCQYREGRLGGGGGGGGVDGYCLSEESS